jgi:hypothetical protein
MSEIIVDVTLQPVPLTRVEYDKFLNTLTGAEFIVTPVPGRSWPDRKLKQKAIIGSSVPETAEAFHKGYFGYLEVAYNSHHGVVISPTTIWYTVLAESAGHIKENAEHYRPLFTNSPGKKDITVLGDAEYAIDPRDFISQLRDVVPVGVDLFLPEFSVADEAYDVAAAAAFCDAVSPYYNYMMLACGISRVRVDGTLADWDNLLEHLDAVAARLDQAGSWFKTIRPHIEKMRAAAAGEVDTDFWKRIYTTKRCGSGSQVIVDGWFKDFAITPPRLAYPENFPPHISNVEVTQVETGRKYKFSAGILHSELKGDYLEPRFGCAIERLAVEAAASAGVLAHP